MHRSSSYSLKHVLFTCLIFLAVVASALGLYQSARAMNPPALQTFYVTMPEDVMMQYYVDVFTGTVATSPVRSVISIAIGTSGTDVYYDQWEDSGAVGVGKYDADIANPDGNYYNAATNPAGTQIWGDGVLANGCPPSINNTPNPCKSPSDDTLQRGDTITLDTWVTVNGASGSFSRSPAQIFYDGRDKIGASMPVAVTRGIYPSTIGSLVADAQNIMPTERWGTQYLSPVGENNTGVSQAYDDVRMLVMAMGATTINVDANADGDFTDAYDRNNFAMTEGQVISVNDPAATINGVTGVKAGAVVNVVSGSPVQVTLITSDYASTYENRFYNLIPYTQLNASGNPETGWVSDYYSPAGTPATSTGGLPSCTNDWIYNPNAAAITVNYDFAGGASPDGSLSVPSKTALAFPNVPALSGAHFYTTGSPAPVFLPISMTDCTNGATAAGNGDIFDWGNELYPLKQLSPELLIGWALGCSDMSYEGICLDTDGLGRTTSRSVVWLTPLANTTIYVDTNGSGITCPGGAGAEKTIAATALNSYTVNDDPTSRYYVHDRFNDANYNHNDAIPDTYTGIPVPTRQNWATNWTETGDSILTAAGGSIWITGGTLQFRNIGTETNMSIQRSRNLANQKFSELSFRIQSTGAPTSALAVEISPDGTNWTTLDTLSGNYTYATGQYANKVYRTSAYNTANTYIRFRMLGDLTGTQTYSIDEVHMDNAPDGDYDMTGAYIRTCDDTPLAAAFGQNPDNSFSGDDEALDLGMSIQPYGSQIKLTKSASADFVNPGDLVTYSYTMQLLQSFSVSVNNISVVDDSCSPTMVTSGDTNSNNFLDPGEVWNFNCTTRLYTETTNTAVGYALYGQDRIRSSPAQDNVKLTSSLGDYVWVDENGDGHQDAGEPGIPNVKITLSGNDMNGGAVNRTTYTDASGHYVFNGLPPSNSSGYMVTVDISSMATGLAANETYDENGVGTPNATTVVLGSDLRYKTADFGYNWASTTETNTNAGTGMIGDRVWSDANSNGIQDAGELGLNNIYVQLITAGADGLFGTSDDVIAATTTTDDNGNYAFDGLSAGAYQVNITSVWPGYTQTGDPDQPGTPCTSCDDLTTTPIVLAPGDVYLNADFGYHLDSSTAATIGDTLWVDTNRDSSVDTGEPRLAGVSVSLIRDLNANGAWDTGEPIISTTLTNASGQYAFTGVPVADGVGSDDYLVWVNDTFHVVAEVVPTYDSDGANPASGVVTGLGVSAVSNLDTTGNLNQDFAFAPGGHLAGTALVGDTVWLDQNGNGTYDVSEGIEGVVVNLLSSSGNVISRTRTNLDGQYFFGDLAAGTYTVDLNLNSLPNYGTELANFVDPDNGRPNRATFTLTSGQVLLTQDFGYRDTSGHTIGGTIWNDANTSGVLDAGEAGRYAGVTVALYTDSNDNGVWDAADMQVGTTTTDSSGNYSFTGLPNDTYFVDVTDNGLVLNGTWNSLGTAGLDNNSQLDPYIITLNGANNTTADFGYYLTPAAIGDFVWNDANRDGLQTSGETGIPNDLVTLTITYPNGAGTTTLNTLTDANGAYKFGNLLLDEDFDGVGTPEPTYSLTFATPIGYNPTTALVGGDRTIDSDGAANVAATIAKGQYNNTVDSGFVASALTIAKTSNVSGAAIAGQDITYTITVTNNTPIRHSGIAINDPLPAGTTYVANSTVSTGYVLGSSFYLDDFQTGLVYTGSGTGSAAWGTNWLEAVDGGSATAGSIQVVAGGAACPSGSGNCLRILPNTANIRVYRTADMSTCNDSGTLSYTYNNTMTSIVVVAARIYVGGVQQGANLATYTNTINRGISSASFTLTPAQMAATTMVSFDVTTRVANAATYLYIDDVKFTCNRKNAASKNNNGGGLSNGVPSNLVVAGDNFALDAGQSMTTTFHATVNSPATLYSIDNTAGVNSSQMGTTWQYASHSDPVQGPAVIGDRVWLDEDSNRVQDAGEAGIPNITMQLWNSGHTTVLQTTTTDSEGNYLFTNVAPGTYRVDVLTSSLPAGLLANPTYDEDGISTANTSSVTVSRGGEHMSTDFGYNWASTTAVTSPIAGDTGTIGDHVWIDANSNGLQDIGEPGLAGIPVALVTPGADGLFGTADDVSAATTTTDAAGNYIFDGLTKGAYVVVVNGGSAPSGYTQTGDADQPGIACTTCDNKTTTPILLAPGDVYINADFGYHPTTSYTIGNQIFLDADANGTFGGSDTAIPGVSVALLDNGGKVIATTVTNTSGQYSFTGVPNGTFTVWVNDTAHVLDYMVQNSRPNNLADNGQVCSGLCNGQNTVIISGASSTYQDFGYTPTGNTSGKGLIGDTIFYDNNANGTYNAGEGLEGIRVRLYQDSNADGNYDSGEPLVVETTTNENGNYYFGNLGAGNYVVKVDTTTLPIGVTNTVDAGDATLNEGGITLAAGGINLAQDFGYRDTSNSNTIGGTLWNDTNTDGLLTAGEAGRFSGVTIVLYDDSGNIVATTTSDGSGNYSFTNLPDGAYSVDVTDASNIFNGYWHSTGPIPGNDNNSQNDPYNVAVSGGQTDTTGDFGYYLTPASIGNFVWLDTNGDGLQTAGEPGISGATVTLTVSWTTGETTSLSTLTDASGNYKFGNLLLDENFDGVGTPEPTYSVAFTTPAGYQPTTALAGSDRTIDSNGTTSSATVSKGQYNDTIDSGFLLPDLTVTKTNNTGGNGVLGTAFNWTLTMANGGKTWATFTNGQTIVRDPLPAGANYGAPKSLTPGNFVNITNSANISCSIDVSNVLICTASGASVTIGALTGSFTVAFSATPTAAGSLVNTATVDNNSVVPETNENNNTNTNTVTIPKASPTIATTASPTTGTVGTAATTGDSATLSSGYNPSGSVTFTLYSDATCATAVSGMSGSGTISGANASWSTSWTPTAAGTYYWKASYPGDTNNNGYTTACGGANEQILISKVSPTIATTASPTSGLVGVAATTGDSATLSSGYNPSGSITFTLYSDATCATAVSGMSGSGTISGTGASWSTSWTPGAAGTYYWKASYPGDTNNNGYTTACGGANELVIVVLPAQLSGYTYNDVNHNGVYDSGTDTPLTGVTIFLDSNNNGTWQSGEPTITSDGTTGYYQFTNLFPGTYHIIEVNPSGYISTGDKDGIANGLDKIDVTLAAGDNNTGNNFLDTNRANISGQVRNDTNNNGVLTDSESGIANVTVTLKQGVTTIATTTTDASGNYNFSNQVAGSYTVVETNPGGYVSTNDKDGNAGGNGLDTIAVTLVANTNNTANDFLDTNVTTVSGQVRNDTNHNGVVTDSESGITSVSIALIQGGSTVATTTTDASGNYTFTNVQPGSYTVVESNPGGYVSTNDKDGSGNGIDTIAVTAVASTPNTGNDFLDTNRANISGQVRNDTNNNGVLTDSESGIANVTVTLKQGVTTIATTTTDASGNYSFNDQVAGSYTVVETNPGGYVSTNDKDGNAGGNGLDTITVTLVANTNNTANDFLDWKPAQLSGYTYNDLNGNGSYDSGTDTPLTSVTVFLDSNNNGTYDTGEPQTTSDGSTGFYQFTNLTAGTYHVIETNPSGYTSTGDKDGALNGLDKIDVTLAIGDNNTGNNFLDWKPATIGDFVWNDANGNGVQDSGEPGISGVTVNLRNSTTGTILQTTTTNSSGAYSFITGSGSYSLEFVNPGGYNPSPQDQGSDDAKDSDVNVSTGRTTTVTVAEGEINNTVDAGFYQMAAIGDYVWLDLNDNGIQDANEPGIKGATVNLYDSTGTTILQTTTTGSDGLYSFTNVVPGGHVVEFFIHGGYAPTLQDQGSDDAKDSDANATTGRTGPITLIGGQTDNTVDAGFYSTRLDLGDLPSTAQGYTYPTLFRPGPAHIVFPDYLNNANPSDHTPDGLPDTTGGVPAVWLGLTIDTEPNGQPTVAANGDGADEDGLTLASSGWLPGQSSTATIKLNSSQSGTTVYYGYWIDWNHDGTFDAFYSGSGVTHSPVDVLVTVSVPAGYVANSDVYMRVRADDQPLTNVDYQGTLTNGEVEDYWYQFTSGGETTPVTLSYFSTVQNGSNVIFTWSTATETGNIGFNLYVKSGNKLTLINTQLIPSLVIDSLDRQDYSFGAKLDGNLFYIEDVSVLGETRQHGPYQLGMTYGGQLETDKINQAAISAEHDAKNVQRQDALEEQMTIPAVVFAPVPAANSMSAAAVVPTKMPVPTKTPSPTRTLKPTATLKPTKTPSPTRTLKPTATLKPTVTPSPTKTLLPTKTTKPTFTPTPTATVLPTATFEPTATDTIDATATTAPTGTDTVEPTAIIDPTVTDTGEPTATTEPTATATLEPTSTTEPTVTATIEPTATFESTATATLEPTSTTEPTVTATIEPTRTFEPTATATPEPIRTFEPTASATLEPTVTFEPTATATPVLYATPVPVDPTSLQLTTTFNLKVRQTGIYRVTYETLRDAGLDLAGVPVAKITVINRSLMIPVYVYMPGQAENFGPGGYVEFYGEALDTLYTDTNIYTMQVSTGSVPQIPIRSAVPGVGLTPVPSYTETLVVNNQKVYSNSAPGIDPWYDTSMLAYTTSKSWDYSFQVDGLTSTSASAALDLVVWGITDWPKNPDHHLVVSINGTTVANEIFDGHVEKTLKISVPVSVLKTGANTMRLTLPGDTGVSYDLISLNKFTLKYPRVFTAQGGRLTFVATGDLINVVSLPSSDVSVYRMRGNGLVRLNDVQVQASGSTFNVSFAGTDQADTYLVTTVGALYTPVLEAAHPAVDLNHPAQYLIISHPDFISGLQPLVAARQAQGLTVSVVNVNDLYAKYTYGIFDPQAIKQYIAYAVKNLGTQYVLLVGGDTYDYRNYLGKNSISFIPSLYVATGPVAEFVPADPLYADVNGDNVPDVAIGRFPVRTTAELSMVVNKTLAYAAKNYSRTAVFATDLNDGTVSFKNIGTQFAAELPTDWSTESVNLDDLSIAAARTNLLAAMNGGTALVTFIGHSGPTYWTFSNLFDITDAAGLTNAGKPFVVVQWGCWNTYYVDPVNNYLVQKFLFSGDNGAAAVLGATTLADSGSEQFLGELLTSRLVRQGETIGQALQDAKLELKQTHPELLDVLLGFSIMGDPAMVIQP